MTSMENTRPSGLKPPTRLPTFAAPRGLQESTPSDLNIRAATSIPQPPSLAAVAATNGSTKHKIGGSVDAPPAKQRKTLVERAGEPTSVARAHQTKSSIGSVSGFGSRLNYTTAGRRDPSTNSIASSISNGRPGSRQTNGMRSFAASARTAPYQEASMEQQNGQESDTEAGITGKRKAWDTNGRLDDMESMYTRLQEQIQSASSSNNSLEESLNIHKTRVQELSTENKELSGNIRTLTGDLDRTRNELHTTTTDMRQIRRDHEREIFDLERRHEKEMADLQLRHQREMEKLERDREKEAERYNKELETAKKSWGKTTDDEIANITSQHWEEMEQARSEHERIKAKLSQELESLRQAGESRATESAGEVQAMRDSLSNMQSQLDASNATTISLRSRITTFEKSIASLEREKQSLVSKTHFLEGNQEAQSSEFTSMSQKLQEALRSRDVTLDTLRKEETLRRKLNAMILELRGNIRVFVRTRPLLDGEEEPAKVDYLDGDAIDGCKEMVVHAPTTHTATGKERNEKHNYSFDRVFPPGVQNEAVFDECQDLIQSVVDGYNVSILSYGQTGSGKTFGMSGPAGIIPSAIRFLLSDMQRLKQKGWDYAMEASFVEVYNETLNDLLGDAKTWDEGDDLSASVRGKKKEKHEIHHDAATGKTTVTNLVSQNLWPPPDGEGDLTTTSDDSQSVSAAATYMENVVTNLLDTAAKNRRVATTKANLRSSRSHSIFMLTLKGTCAATGESSEGILNLVDLAGSERLKQSGAEGSRMKETQAINKSLSSLGDVIAALGNKSTEAHIPYRNSKLTYLLQSSLGGTTANGKSSRTLMLLHISPLHAHWQESRSSLLFGSKVHGTHIGTAKKR